MGRRRKPEPWQRWHSELRRCLQEDRDMTMSEAQRWYDASPDQPLDSDIVDRLHQRWRARASSRPSLPPVTTVVLEAALGWRLRGIPLDEDQVLWVLPEAPGGRWTGCWDSLEAGSAPPVALTRLPIWGAIPLPESGDWSKWLVMNPPALWERVAGSCLEIPDGTLWSGRSEHAAWWESRGLAVRQTPGSDPHWWDNAPHN